MLKRVLKSPHRLRKKSARYRFATANNFTIYLCLKISISTIHSQGFIISRVTRYTSISFTVDHDSRSAKTADYVVTKIPLPPPIAVFTLRKSSINPPSDSPASESHICFLISPPSALMGINRFVIIPSKFLRVMTPTSSPVGVFL